MDQIPIIILAAGKSSRLGQPKQLLQFNGETLLNKTIRIANEISNNITVVLGFESELIAKSINNPSVKIVININWESGLSSSVVSGLKPNLDQENVIFTLCDQPFLTSQILQCLITKWKLFQKPIVASNYGKKIGVPMLFNNLIYNDLLKIEGEKGAKPILKKYPEFVSEISFPNGQIDIDTVENWEDFLKNQL